MKKTICGLILCGAIAWGVVPAAAGTVSGTYTDLPLGTPVNLTGAGTLDWVKWGLNGGGPGWTAVAKNGVTPVISRTLTPVGTPFPGTSVVLTGIPAIPPGNVLNFSWSDGTAPPAGFSDTIVTETLLPAQFSYPIGLGASMTAPATAGTRVLDVYVQGFNADMQITATMSGGGSDTEVVSPTKNPPGDPTNNFSAGRYRVTFSGAGEVLTVTVRTVNPAHPGGVAFPNAGFFAAALRSADHPLALALNATAFEPGDTMALTITLTPDGIAGLVDAYVLLRLPDSTFLSLQLGGTVVPGIAPLASGFAPFAVSGELLRVTIPGGVPAATFTWVGALTQAGTANVIGAVDEVPFTFEPLTVSKPGDSRSALSTGAPGTTGVRGRITPRRRSSRCTAPVPGWKSSRARRDPAAAPAGSPASSAGP